jgi:hypothetical protein
VVAKQLVELMGGIIGVESTAGTGSAFWFELAGVPEPDRSPQGPDAATIVNPIPSSPIGMRTLLYVEDNRANLMDINLPGISGFEALALLRADPSTAQIPVIALSANAMQQDVDRGLKAGFLRYIPKPIRVREFTEALKVALDKAKPAGEGGAVRNG